MVNWVITIGEIIAFIAAISNFVVIIRNEKKYVGNQFFATSMILYGIYAFFMFLFDLSISESLLPLLMSFALFIATFATTFFFLSFQIFLRGADYLKMKATYIIFGITIIIASLIFIKMPTFESLNPPRVNKNLIVQIIMGGWQVLVFITNIVNLTRDIKRIGINELNIKKKLVNFRLAQIFGIMSPIMSVVTGIFWNEILVMLQFIFLAIALTIITANISRKL